LSWWQLSATAVLLVALPFLPQEVRLKRTALQAALVAGCLISAVGLILRSRRPGAGSARWAALTGFVFALSYLTREESISLLPVVVCAMVAVLAGAWADGAWRWRLAASGCLLGAFAIPLACVSGLNYRSYGVFLTATRRAPEYLRAHRVLTSLEPETRERYVPISTATRLKAYALSPTFASFRSYLEGPASDSIATNPLHLKLYGRPATTREFFVINFEFPLREAALNAGAHTAPESERMFGALSSELEAAIASGKIQAGSSGPPPLAAPLPGDYGRILRQTLASLRQLYALEGLAYAWNATSSGNPSDLQRMATLTHSPLAPTREMKSVELPPVGLPARRAVYTLISTLEMAAYAITTFVLLAFATATAFRRRRDHLALEQIVAGLALCSAVVAFSLTMGVVEVLGFPHLRTGRYNVLGYSPLSVTSAFGLVVLSCWVESGRKRQEQNPIT
jgi:hypothetical protein